MCGSSTQDALRCPSRPLTLSVCPLQDTQDRLDLDQYDTMVLRVLGDGRRYIASIRTENWIIGEASSHDVYQAFLFARWGDELPGYLDEFADGMWGWSTGWQDTTFICLATHPGFSLDSPRVC